MKVNGQWVACIRFSSVLKMCMWFGYNPQIKFAQSFFGYFDNESKLTVGTSCAQLLQFYSDSFETIQIHDHALNM